MGRSTLSVQRFAPAAGARSVQAAGRWSAGWASGGPGGSTMNRSTGERPGTAAGTYDSTGRRETMFRPIGPDRAATDIDIDIDIDIDAAP